MLMLLATAAADAAPMGAPSWGRMLMSLLAVFVLIGVLTLLLKLLRGRIHHNGPLSQEASLSLGRNERVVVVRGGNNSLLLWVTASQISTLAKLPDAPPLPPTTKSSAAGSWLEQGNNWLKQRRK